MKTIHRLLIALIWATMLLPQTVTAQVDIIIDNPSAVVTGDWHVGTMATNKYGDDYYWSGISPSGGRSVTYIPQIPVSSDDWYVYTWYPHGSNRPTQAQYIVRSATGDTVTYVNQQVYGGQWVYIGKFTMEAGGGNYVRITNFGSETDKAVMADAVRFYSPTASGDVSPPEFRAAWIDAWGIGFLNSSQTTQMVNTLANANYNVIIPQVRKAGDAYYLSSYEPRATNISEHGYDPLADIIAKARARGMEVHPWIVTYRIWQTNWPSPPEYHIWSQRPDWADTDSSGNIAQSTSYNLDPGVPGVQQYIADIVKDIVSKYDVDGINLDYIRYMGTAWGYNPLTRERFKQEYGYYPPTSSSDPNWSTWCDFRRRQVTDLVRKCYVEALHINPNIKFSVDTIGWTGANPNVDFTLTRPYTQVFQDHRAWLEEGIIDINMLMNYKNKADSVQRADFRSWTDYLAANRHGRHFVNGPGVYMNSITNSVTQMLYGRSVGCDGIATYSYRSTNNEGKSMAEFYAAVEDNVFTSPAPIPDMPWKSNPTTGIIFGQVTDASQPDDPIYQDWIYKAEVTVSGPISRTVLTDATGTYAFLNLTPGVYTVTSSKDGFPVREYQGMVLAAGDVIRQDMTLGSTDITETKRAENDMAVGIDGVVVSAAFQDFFYVQAHDGSSGIRVEMTGHGLTNGMTARVSGKIMTSSTGERYIEASSVEAVGFGKVSHVFMNNRSLGGGDWHYDASTGAGQRGVRDGTGLNNIGLLVRTSGRVEYVDPSGDFAYIDDGSNVSDGNTLGVGGSAVPGVRVHTFGSGLRPVGEQVIVTGISSMEMAGGQPVRVVLMTGIEP